MTLEERLRKFVCDFLGEYESDVVPHASFIDDLGADSLDLVRMFANIEEEFEIDIPVEDAARLVTFQNLLDYIETDGTVDFSGNGSNFLLSGESIRVSQI